MKMNATQHQVKARILRESVVYWQDILAEAKQFGNKERANLCRRMIRQRTVQRQWELQRALGA
jgi:hypothetical protein